MGLKGNILIGVASGVVGGLLTPLLVPGLKKGARPVAKGVIKGGLRMYEKGRELTAHAGEVIEDVVAEIHAEQHAADVDDETLEAPDSQTAGETGHLRPAPAEAENPGMRH